MIRHLNEIVELTRKNPQRRIAVAAAAQASSLVAMRRIVDEKIGIVTLVGDEQEIHALADASGISLCGVKVVHVPDPYDATLACCRMASEGEVDVVAKGMLDSAIFLKAVMSRQGGLRMQGQVSHVSVFEVPTYEKLLMISDAAVNIRPTLQQKVTAINHCVGLAKILGNTHPLVACICGIEKVNPELMPETAEAAMLTQMNRRGQISGCTVDGPLALDNAVNLQSAQLKNCEGPVAGRADILLAHDLNAANALYKSLVYFAQSRVAALVLGFSAPVVLTSRADNAETKYLSMSLGLLCADHQNSVC